MTTKNQLLIYFIFLIISNISVAQTPNYFQNETKWRINSSGLSFDFYCAQIKEYVCEIEGDTLIDGNIYKKLIHHGRIMEQPIQWGTSCNSTSIFQEDYSFLRQDGYKIFTYDGQDVLLYDFDLQVGDTLPQSYNNYSTNTIVDSIDTFYIGAEVRRIFHLSDNPENWGINKLIEGIGHNWGLIGTMQPFEFFENELVCYSVNNIEYYSSGISECNWNVGINERIKQSEVTISPNPADNKINLEIENSQNILDISVIDVSGKHFDCQFSMIDSELIEINTSSLNNGIYFIQLKTEKNENAILKFIKN